jgi:hypothetical protein
MPEFAKLNVETCFSKRRDDTLMSTFVFAKNWLTRLGIPLIAIAFSGFLHAQSPSAPGTSVPTVDAHAHTDTNAYPSANTDADANPNSYSNAESSSNACSWSLPEVGWRSRDLDATKRLHTARGAVFRQFRSI